MVAAVGLTPLRSARAQPGEAQRSAAFVHMTKTPEALAAALRTRLAAPNATLAVLQRMLKEGKAAAAAAAAAAGRAQDKVPSAPVDQAGLVPPASSSAAVAAAGKRKKPAKGSASAAAAAAAVAGKPEDAKRQAHQEADGDPAKRQRRQDADVIVLD